MIEIFLKFCLYSVAGWAVEMFWNILMTGKVRQKRMLLYMPMCPVYGFGGVLIPSLLSGFEENALIMFIAGAILASAVELLYYLICLCVFRVRIWNYSSMRFNYCGGICLEYSVMWGLLAGCVVWIIDPAVDKLIYAMPGFLKFMTGVFMGVLTASDIRLTAKCLLEIKKNGGEFPACFWYMEKFSENLTKQS